MWGYYAYHPITGELNNIYETSSRIHYLTLPIYYNLTIKKVKLFAGIQYSKILAYNVDIRNAYPMIDYDTTSSYIGDVFNNSNFCICGSIAYPILKNTLLEVRYNHGLIKVTDKNAGWGNESKTRQLLLGVRYYFR